MAGAVPDEHGLTAARWRASESSPLAIYARTGVVQPGIEAEIDERLAVAGDGALDHIGVDATEEIGDLHSLLENVRPELAKARGRGDGRRSLKVRIIDEDALGAPIPEAIRQYLTAHGWHRDVPDGTHPDMWVFRTPEGKHHVLAPWSQEFTDYPRRVAELLRTLSIVEERSELDIIRDLDPPDLHGRLPVVAEAAELLGQIADARREYTEAPTSRENRVLILHEAGVLSTVADALAGRSRWSDLVGSYAPSWRWRDFGDHNPELTFRRDTERTGIAARAAHVSAPYGGRPFIRPVAEASITSASARGRGVPRGWVVEKVGRWQGIESEVVYDRRRFDVTISGGSSPQWDDKYVAGLQAHGWEHQAADGRSGFWILDRVASARGALARHDQRVADVGVDSPDIASRPSAPEVEL